MSMITCKSRWPNFGLAVEEKKVTWTKEQMIAEVVSLTELVPDRCNYEDREFETGVDRFMKRFMPGMTLCLLAKGWEHWEIAQEQIEVQTEMDEDGGECFFVEDAYGDRHDFAEESDAEHFAEEAMEEREQNRLGSPWAWNWFHMPDEVITDEDLFDSGWVVAQFRPDPEDEYSFRLCGIDGCGYSFSGAHFATLYAKVAERLGWKVDTENGRKYITTDGATDANV